jgi:ribosomal protein L32
MPRALTPGPFVCRAVCCAVNGIKGCAGPVEVSALATSDIRGYGSGRRCRVPVGAPVGSELGEVDGVGHGLVAGAVGAQVVARVVRREHRRGAGRVADRGCSVSSAARCLRSASTPSDRTPLTYRVAIAPDRYGSSPAISKTRPPRGSRSRFAPGAQVDAHALGLRLGADHPAVRTLRVPVPTRRGGHRRRHRRRAAQACVIPSAVRDRTCGRHAAPGTGAGHVAHRADPPAVARPVARRDTSPARGSWQFGRRSAMVIRDDDSIC